MSSKPKISVYVELEKEKLELSEKLKALNTAKDVLQAEMAKIFSRIKQIQETQKEIREIVQ